MQTRICVNDSLPNSQPTFHWPAFTSEPGSRGACTHTDLGEGGESVCAQIEAVSRKHNNATSAA